MLTDAERVSPLNALKFIIEVYHSLFDKSIDDDTDSVTNSGGRLNKKDGLTRYGNSHVKDKTS